MLPVRAALTLRTPRLTLECVDAALAAALATNDHVALARATSAAVAPGWPEAVMVDALPRLPEWYATIPALSEGWGMWMIFQSDGAPPQGRTLIGSAGFKGPPTPEGECEVGYGVVASKQGVGFGTEATRALLAWAFERPAVRRVLAATLPDHESSLRVMRKCGMSFIGPGPEEDGLQTVLWGVERAVFERIRADWGV